MGEERNIPMKRSLAILEAQLLGLALVLGCSSGPPGLCDYQGQSPSGCSLSAQDSLPRLLPAAAEDDWPVSGVEAPAPEPGEKKVRIVAGGGVALPWGAKIGYAPGEKLPNFGQIWDIGPALGVSAEFTRGKSLAPYVGVGMSSFWGKVWADPDDPWEVWQAEDGRFISVLGGVRLGGRFYGRLGGGLVFWPEARLSNVFGLGETSVYRPGAKFGFEAGGGFRFKLFGLKAFLEADYRLNTAPAASAEAKATWAGFSRGGPMSAVAFIAGLSF